MKILVNRVLSDAETSISIIKIDGVYCCVGLEDEPRKIKVPGETRIPSGVYKVSLKCHGGMHGRYKEKFNFHQGMLQVMDIPNFTDVLIHIGNDDDDTDACLLLGRKFNGVGRLRIEQSRLAYVDFYNKVVDAALSGELIIEYRDSDLH